LINRHEALRTLIKEEAQHILPTLTFDVPLIDLSQQAKSELDAWFAKELQTPFDLINGPLLRVTLLKLQEKEYWLIITAHHIIVDGLSINLMIQELAHFYTNACQGKISVLEPPRQYREYVQWQNQQILTKAMANHETYWLTKLSGKLPVLNLPTDYPTPANRSYRGSRQTLSLTREVCHAVKIFAQKQGCTPFMAFFAVYALMLHRLTGQEDIIVGIPTAGRSLPGSEKMVGYCTHLLPIRSLIGQQSFLTYLKNIRATLLEAYQHQDYPYAHLINKLKWHWDGKHSSLVAAAFNLDQPATIPELFELQAQWVSQDVYFTDFELIWNLTELDGEYVLDCTYNADAFQTDTILRWMNHYQTLLATITQAEQSICKLPLLNKTEYQHLLLAWNETQTAYSHRCVHHLFEQQVQNTPHAIAVVFEDKTLTYEALNAKANQLAHYLQKVGVQPDTVVGLCLERSLEMVIGMLGILKAGGAYLPLEPSYPAARLAFMWQEAKLTLLLTQKRLLAQLPKEFSANPKTAVLSLDSDWNSVISSFSVANPISSVIPEHLAYVIYTSGSTGKPKGVMITHQALCNHTFWMQATYPLTEQDKLLQKTPISFDASVWEFYSPLLHGAQLVMAKPNGHKDTRYLIQALWDYRITTLQVVPSLLQVLVQEDGFENLRSLKHIFSGGEQLTGTLVKECLSKLEEVEIINLYGPTEACIQVTSYRCQSNQPIPTVIPIGKPISNTQIYLLDTRLQPVPVGIPGELYIGGVCLARGYLNHPELTEERFISNPLRYFEPVASFNDFSPRLYKTGDLARYLFDGTIEYLGRVDNQVKIRGFRIELGEIEQVLAQYPGLRESAVIVHTDATGEKRLIAYVVNITSLDQEELRRFLGEQLPDFMIPGSFVTLASMPLTPSGKIDRLELAKLAVTSESNFAKTTLVAPRTPEEQQLAEIWAQVLGLQQIGIHDNFFELGGHSLLATRVMSKVRKVFAVNLPPTQLFETPTIASFMEPLLAKKGLKSTPRAEEREQVVL
jgi:amino acid adenylation domain-containing protein